MRLSADKKHSVRVIYLVSKLLILLLLPIFLQFVSLEQMELERSICLIKNIFGVNCYACGITKAIIAAIQIDLLRAYHYNSLIVIVIPLLVYVWVREILQTVRRLRLRATT